MQRVISFIIFFSIFITILLLMHIIIILNISKHFSWVPSWQTVVILLLLAFSFPLASIIERTLPSIISRYFYIGSSVLLGLAFIMLMVIAVVELVSLLVAIPYTGQVIVILTLMVTAIAIFNGSSFTVKEVEIDLNLENEIHIVQISDLHVGTTYQEKYLTKVINRINSLNPDIVVITGDLFDSTRKLPDQAFQPLDRINAETLFITGNHENYEGLDYVFSTLAKTKVHVLDDSTFNFKGVQFVGTSHPLDERRTNDALEKIELDKKIPKILLNHAPTGLDQAAKAGISLQLSGHTHGGQIFPFSLLVRLAYPYIVGLHDHNGMQIYISPGTSTWGPPMRLGSRNEVTLLNLR